MAVYRRPARSRFTLLLLVLTSITLLTLDYRGTGSGVVEAVKDGARDVFAPVQDVSDKVFSPVGNFVGGVLHYGDLKSENQRLVCLSTRWPDGRPCPAPFLLLQDVGATFGPRKVDLRDWEKAAIWKDRAACTITMEDLPVGGATFEVVQIGEEGRVFLGSLLKRLTDAQLGDLFAGARFDQRRGPWGGEPIAEWVRVFKARRDAIAVGPACPPA